MKTIDVVATFELIDCANCHIVFGVGEEHVARLRKSGANFFCPAGHSLSFGESETDKLRKELERAKAQGDRLEARVTHLRDQAAAAERSRAAHQAQATRLRNRIGKGVCPCCNRTFADVARHMSGQHPDFAAAGAES
jgi:hypothetical protein